MRFLIFTLLFHCSFMALAQQKHFEDAIGWRGNKIELHTISNKSKNQSCTFAVNSDSIRAFVFNDQVQPIRQFALMRNSGEKILGGFIRDSIVYLFTEKSGSDELRSCMLDIATGKIKEKYIAFDLNKEKTVDHISAGDRFLYFTSNKRTLELNIYIFTNEHGCDTLRYAFPQKMWEDLTTYKGLSRVVSVEKVDLEGECSINTAVKGNKLYPRNDTLLLVMNNHRDSTYVYSFDLENKKVNNWLIKHHSDVFPGTDSYADNSFLLRNKLYYVIATSDSMCMQVVDLYTGAINKSFVANREDTILFKNTPIIQEGGQYSFGASRELTKTRQLLRKMVNGDAVITATLNYNNQVEVIVGSYAEMRSGGGGYMMMAGAPGAPMVMLPTGGFSRGGWVKSARFKTLLNASTFEHINGEIGNSINERIEYYTEGIRIPSEAENLFMTSGRYYHAYYSRDERKLIILKF